MRQRSVPKWCECRDADSPSPFHCACGRWKPSAAPVCEVCSEEVSASLRQAPVFRHALTDDQVRDVRKAIAQHVRQVDLAVRYGCSDSTISSIATRRSRRDVA